MAEAWSDCGEICFLIPLYLKAACLGPFSCGGNSRFSSAMNLPTGQLHMEVLAQQGKGLDSLGQILTCYKSASLFNAQPLFLLLPRPECCIPAVFAPQPAREKPSLSLVHGLMPQITLQTKILARKELKAVCILP